MNTEYTDKQFEAAFRKAASQVGALIVVSGGQDGMIEQIGKLGRAFLAALSQETTPSQP